MHTFQPYCRRVQLSVASHVPRAVPEHIRHAVSPAVLDGKPWWTWHGAVDSEPETTWVAYQEWKSSWCITWESYPLDTWSFLGQVNAKFGNLVGTSIDSAHAATLLLDLDDLLLNVKDEPVMVCQRGNRILGWVAGSRLQTVAQGAPEIVLSQSRMLLSADGQTHQIRGWRVTPEGAVEARTEAGTALDLNEDAAQALMQFGNYSPTVDVYRSVFGDVACASTDNTQQALAFSMNNFQRLLFHTLP